MMKKLIIGIVIFVFLLAGCTQSAPPKADTPMVEKPQAPVPEEKMEKVPEPAPPLEPAQPTGERTLGEGNNAIKESELPTYNESQDRELEELTKGLEK